MLCNLKLHKPKGKTNVNNERFFDSMQLGCLFIWVIDVLAIWVQIATVIWPIQLEINTYFGPNYQYNVAQNDVCMYVDPKLDWIFLYKCTQFCHVIIIMSNEQSTRASVRMIVCKSGRRRQWADFIVMIVDLASFYH